MNDAALKHRAWSVLAKSGLANPGSPDESQLKRIRLKPEQTASFRSGETFIKLYLGPEATARAEVSHAAQNRAAQIFVHGAPASVAPGPLIENGFAMPWLGGKRLAETLRNPFSAERRRSLLARTADILRPLHDCETCEPVHFGGWPAKTLRATADRVCDQPWPGFADEANRTADVLWNHRETKSPGGWVHGDLHVDNVMVGRARSAETFLSLIDFNKFGPRPVISDIAFFLVSVASRTPMWRTGRRGHFGMDDADCDVFLARYAVLSSYERLLALHMKRFAMMRAAMAFSHKNRGLNQIRQRRLRRLRKLTMAIDTT